MKRLQHVKSCAVSVDTNFRSYEALISSFLTSPALDHLCGYSVPAQEKLNERELIYKIFAENDRHAFAAQQTHTSRMRKYLVD